MIILHLSLVSLFGTKIIPCVDIVLQVTEALFVSILFVVLWSRSVMSLCNPLDCSLPGSSIQGIFQARILEWVAISFSRRSSWPRDWTRVSCIVGIHLTVWATRGLDSLLFRRNHFCWSVLKFIDCFHYHIHYAFKPIY